MTGTTSTYYILAWIIVAAIGLFGLGMLFVRASNVERRNFVGAITIVFTAIAAALLWTGRDKLIDTQNGLALSAVCLSLLGFFGARAVDYLLGPRSRPHRDPATLGAELSD